MKISEVRTAAKLNQWWKPKATNLLVVLYFIMLITQLPVMKSLMFFVPSVLTILGIGSFGHLVNDWNDIRADKIAGKVNRMAGLNPMQRSGLLLLSLLLALLPWLILPLDEVSVMLLTVEFLLLVAYAAPPFRLKEKKIWPVFIDSLYAYALPAVLAAHTFFLAANKKDDLLFLGFLSVWQLAMGLRHYLNHLALDRDNDMRTQTGTLATEKGNRYIQRSVSKGVFPLELCGFTGLLLVVVQEHPAFALACLSVLLILNSLYLILALGRDYSLVFFRFSNLTTDRYYQKYLPYIPLLFLTFPDWEYAFILPAHFLLFHRYKGRFPFRGMPVPRSFISRYLVYYPAVALGAPFYYLLKATGKPPAVAQQSIAREPRKVLSTRNGAKADDHREARNIAIVNINKSKYTETFIWKMIPRLPYRVFYLYGSELPLYDHQDRHFLSNWQGLQRYANFIESAFGLPQDYFLKQSITAYLYSRNIRLVLAEFGPVGVQMLPLTRDLGIPLIVNFHGYDIFHREIVSEQLPGYKELFSEAKKIIGVSEYMLDRLQQLGAPREKLVHLPAFVDLELFAFNDHSGCGPDFLVVGRFTETKSPHLTLLAFSEVVREIPHATLTFIGKGGGGALFEACLIMTRALGLEHNVRFRGIQTPEEVAFAMRGSRALVQHSLTTPEHGDMEGKPVAVMEAMAAGLPVIATRHSGIPELITHQKTGILVAEYDIEEMSEWMIQLARDEDLVLRIGRAASKAIRANPLYNNYSGSLSRIIDSALL